MIEKSAKSTDLFDFHWPVDQDGYEVETIPGSKSERITLLGNWGPYDVLRRKGGPQRFYRPLVDAPGLAREFSELPEEGYLDFICRFGFLSVNPDDHIQNESVSEWQRLQGCVRDILEARDAGDVRKAVDIYNQTGHFLRTYIDFSETTKRHLRIIPLSLFGVMMLQVADELTTGIEFQRCLNCTTYFPRRSNKKFCSDRCKAAHNRKMKMDGNP